MSSRIYRVVPSTEHLRGYNMPTVPSKDNAQSTASADMLHYETYIAYLSPDGRVTQSLMFYSADLPDLCAIAATLQEPYTMTTYHGTTAEMCIVEEYDEPGDKGNYAGVWHTADYDVSGQHRLSPWLPKKSSLLP
jgi:hypothetical protein